MLDFVADKNSSLPVYKQLADYLYDHVVRGKLREGEKLPSEREFSEYTKLARATIKKAYELLERRGVLEVQKGSGTYVAGKGKTNQVSSESGLEVIRELVSSMQSNGYGLDEVRSLFNISIDERLSLTPKVKVAAIDCNPETLDIIEHQISSYNNILFSKFLLENVLEFKQPEKTLADFDFIFTTTTHFSDLTSVIPTMKSKVIKAVLSPDIETVIGLKNIDKNANVGLIARSARFEKIALDFINNYSCEFKCESYVFRSNNYDALAEFINDKDVIIIPPVYALKLESFMNKKIFDFFRTGGKVVIFNYTIEQGSLIYIEEKALAIANSGK